MSASSIEAVLLAGLTDGGDESPGMSVLSDAHRELAALADLLGLDLDGEPLDRDPMIVLLDGIERRLRAGLGLLRLTPTERDQEDMEVTKDAGPESAT